MEALRSSYGGDSDSDSDSDPLPTGGNASSKASVSEEGYIGRATDLWLSGDLKVVEAEVVMSPNMYLIDFSEWEVFVNDDCTRSFLSVEIKKQIQAVNEVYKLHNLPEFYKLDVKCMND
ncbi:hypothetical protein C3L33_03027, partial [Rhododendron williamsianum]